MKKLFIITMCLILSALLLVSCSDKETAKDKNDPTLSMAEYLEKVPYDYDLSKYITVEKSDYTGIEVTKIDATVTDQDLNDAIFEALDAASTLTDVTDRGAQMGDTVVMDYKGSVDGEYFDGGEDADFETVLGEAGFIDGFEDAIVGHSAGEEFVIDVTFPEDYNEELGGKAAKFEINLKSVKEKVLPELTVDFVKEHSDYETVEDYIAYLTEQKAIQNLEEAEAEQKNEAFSKIYASVELIDYPKEEYEYYYNDYVDYYKDMAETYYGVDLDTFITEIVGSTEDEFYYYADVSASQYVGQELIIFSIANAENMINTITKGDYDAFLVELAEMYASDVDTVVAQFGEDEIWKALVTEKVMDFIMANSVEVEPTEETPTDPEEPTVIEGVTVTE